MTTALVLLAVLSAAVMLFTVRVGGRIYLRTQFIDARADMLSREEYDAAIEKNPEEIIRWSVPVGGERFDSFSEELRIVSLPEEDAANLGYFPNLRRVDARGCTDYAALETAEDLLPGVSFERSVECSEGELDAAIRQLQVRAMDYAELRAILPHLRELERVDLRSSRLSEEECAALESEFARVRFSYTVDVWGQSVDSDTRVLRLKGGTSGGTQEMIAALGRLKSLERAELRGADIAPAQLCELLPYLPEGETSYDILLFGRRFGSDAEEMDLSGTPMEDTQELEAAIGLMPKLGKVVMCDCGIPDEQMGELREKYAPVSFVWTVHFGVYSLRTDAKSFCGNDLPKYGFVAPPIDDAELEPLKYCTELIALDLGHMKVGDISFLENMPHIKYLILVEESFTDISVIGTLQELEYLELFQNTIDDVSPLLNCRELRHLNLGFSSGFDPEPLKEMTRLKRLWCPGCGFDADTVRAIKQALSDTDCYMPSFDRQGSTGGGWRLDPEYIKMRDAFGMHYQDGRAKK